MDVRKKNYHLKVEGSNERGRKFTSFIGSLDFNADDESLNCIVASKSRFTFVSNEHDESERLK